jgi:hypothetical protein
MYGTTKGVNEKCTQNWLQKHEEVTWKTQGVDADNIKTHLKGR